MSGDLISHAFQCKYNALFPHSAPEAYTAFVEKTVDYVIEELDKSFPGVPVFVAMGNNDSDCGDYRLDAHSEFLRVTGKKLPETFPHPSARLLKRASLPAAITASLCPHPSKIRGCWF